jgi:acetyl-CoA carboxylase biotin carboxyl carrier protein
LPENSKANWLEAVRQVVAAVKASDVTELELGNADFLVRVRREPIAAGGGQAPAAAQSTAKESDAHLHRVVAPFTGVFYRSPTPSAAAFVDEGDWVDADAVVALVETMKIFNEVTADVAGRIERFEAENGQLVHAGEVLCLIEPAERATAESEPHL